jgi:hypothetical protein
VTAGALPFLSRKAAGDGDDTSRGAVEGYRAGKAERFGMGPAVVLGQGLAEAAGPVCRGAAADLAAGERQLGNGDGEAAGR